MGYKRKLGQMNKKNKTGWTSTLAEKSHKELATDRVEWCQHV